MQGYLEKREIEILFGCHQLRVHEDGVAKTVFRMRMDTLKFTVMPFGLTNAPEVS